MKKLVRGIVDFKKNVRPMYAETFAKLALGQSPDVLFVACSDSRVVPNLFASTDPGDLFVLRNVGNLVPPCGEDGFSVSDESEIAAIEFSLNVLNVSDVIICGHSECGAMSAVVKGRQLVAPPHLQAWLRHAEPTLERVARGESPDPALQQHNQVSQLNVLLQLEHLMSYPIVADRVKAGKLRLHGWWFELHHADVYFYDPARKKFILINEKEAEFILSQL